MSRALLLPYARASKAWPALLLLVQIAGVAVDGITPANHRSAPLAVGPGGQPGFTSLPTHVTGANFTNLLTAERGHTNQIYLNGSGVAAGDVDGDGWCDFFVCGLGGRSALFKNLGGWRFTNTTAAAGLAVTHLDATGAALADLEGDGDLDLVVNSLGSGTFLFLNDGRGQFQFAPSSPVLNRRRGGTSVALADLDGDGALDLYIPNYRTDTIRDMPKQQFTFQTLSGQPQAVALGGRPLTAPYLSNRFAFCFRAGADGGGTVFHDEHGEPDALFRNLGGGRFAPVAFPAAFADEWGRPLREAPLDWGLSVVLRDFNGDGAPDIYVCNDFSSPDRLWLNNGRGQFRAAPTNTLGQMSFSSMGVDVADVNRDGFDDFFVVDMLSGERWRRLVQQNEPNPNVALFIDPTMPPQTPRNTLQLARGDGTYAEVAQFAGLEGTEWSWTPVFLDVDLDGYEDLLVSNGFERDFMNGDANRKLRELERQAGPRASAPELLTLRKSYPRLATPNLAFRNQGGLKFTNVSRAWGFDTPAIGQGMCLADLDGDGDQDVLINNFNGPVELLRNNSTAPRVAVRLKGRSPNTRGIGAKIRLLGGAVPVQSQEMICGGRYLSSDDPMRVFAAGSLTNRMTLEVTWRNGTRSVVTNVGANRIYEVDEARAEANQISKPAAPEPPLFRDASNLLGHAHTASAFDDFERQPLLPHKLSALAPGVSWFDVDGDGWDDLLLPATAGTAPAAFRNDGRGGFSRLSAPPPDLAANRSQTTLLGWRKRGGEVKLIAGSSNYEDGRTNGNAALQYDLASRAMDESLPGTGASTGPMAMADVDGDGELDLFVGGRVIPGRYPEAASSLLFRGTNGSWATDAINTKLLAGVGLVTSAVFSDLDADGWPDLVLACEWGPLKLFRNARGTLEAWNPPVLSTPHPSPLTLLSSLPGWWNSVAAGDFDGDGRMDLIAGNWGGNSKYETLLARPLHLYYGDFNGDGGVGLIESGYDATLRQDAPLRHVTTMARGLPWLLAKYDSFAAFSRASVPDMLGERLPSAKKLEAAWLASSVFLNRGDHFQVHPLPVEAQLAPAFGLAVADFDGDGSEDVFVAQNFFATRSDTSRYDAGRGLLLRGDGRGHFHPMSGTKSGLRIHGEQRGTAVADYDGDGRSDLAVAQHGAATRLFHNETAQPGLRVRLRGPAGNPHGVGAIVRLKFGEKFGPAREIHAGSGYWSQDSVVPVLATPQKPTALWCRWPGGRTSLTALPEAREVTINVEGQLEARR